MPKNNPHNLTVGQKLYIVYDRNVSRNGTEFLVVTKIGNKWATLQHPDRTWATSERVDLEDMRLDGGQYSSPGKAYLSEQHYKTEMELNEAWRAFQQSLSYSQAPKGLTIEKLEQIKVLLGPPYSKV